MQNKHIVLTAAAVAAVGVGATYAVKSGVHTAAAAKAPTVAVADVQPGHTSASVMAEGSIVPSNFANVSVLPKYSAQVTGVYVNIGTRVQKGQLLADLDPIEQQADMQQSKVAQQSARAKYNLALHPHQPQEMRQMQLKLSQDKESIAAAQASLTMLQKGNPQQDIDAAAEAVKSAQSRLALDTSDLHRSQVLFSKDLIAKAELEVAQTKVDIDGNDLAQAQQRLSLLQAGARPEEVQKARAALAAARLGMQSDEQAYTLLKMGSRPEVIQQAADDVAQAQIAAQHQNLVFARRHVYAPMAGIVVERNVNLGEIASASAGHLDANAPLGTPAKGMFVIAADNSVEFMASVDQRFYRSVRPGQPASVSIEAYPGRSFAGKISRMKPLINPQMGGRNGALPLTFAMWVRVPNPDRALVFGQTGLITVNSKQAGLVVPQAALNSFTLGKGVVYTVSGGVVHARPVRYDGTSDGTVRILSGLRLGDKVVVSDTSKLVGGQKVRTVAADPHDNGAFAL